MRPSRPLLTSLALACATLSLGGSTGRTAALLPEVMHQMNDAHKASDAGTLDFAIAHADLILLPETVSVSTKFESIPDAQRKTCVRALDASLAAWESALGKTIHFRKEEDPSKADISIRFRSDVRMGREAVAGFTNWKRTIKTEGAKVVETAFKADVQIRARDLSFAPMSYEAMRQETEHELGHILGLEDSEHQGDLMGALDISHPVNGPRDYEVDAVRSLRDEAKQVKADAIARQKQAG